MSGVIDENGTQWEKCNRCLQFVDINELCYEQPSEQYEYGRDLCPGCFDGTISDAEAEELVADYIAKRDAYIASPEYQEFFARINAGTWRDNGDGSHSFIPAGET